MRLSYIYVTSTFGNPILLLQHPPYYTVFDMDAHSFSGYAYPYGYAYHYTFMYVYAYHYIYSISFP